MDSVLNGDCHNQVLTPYVIFPDMFTLSLCYNSVLYHVPGSILALFQLCLSKTFSPESHRLIVGSLNAFGGYDPHGTLHDTPVPRESTDIWI